MTKLIVDNLAYAKIVKKMGFRANCSTTDLSDILPEELEQELKEASEISMGTEISEEDLENIHALCDQIISITEYRTQLYEYLKNRMNAIAPNLTALVGDLVGARLIAHAGSLMTLAKHPASTIQILGAEKALFRALKTKHDTPKYGLIYHASLIGQAGPKMKGKIARMVATKAALSIRVDALGETESPEIGIENRGKVEARLRMLEGHGGKPSGADRKAAGNAKGQKKHEFVASSSYNTSTDATMTSPSSEKKRKADSDSEESSKKVKKEKKEKKDKKDKEEKKEDKKEDKKEKKEKKEKKDKKEKKEKK
ncbi:Nucleolar protein 58 [Mortierella sp. 14UC]|nr:Nucleolar protein 58 [Mortierella sp. 14UC]